MPSAFKLGGPGQLITLGYGSLPNVFFKVHAS
jgi:hypothetical protein